MEEKVKAVNVATVSEMENDKEFRSILKNWNADGVNATTWWQLKAYFKYKDMLADENFDRRFPNKTNAQKFDVYYKEHAAVPSPQQAIYEANSTMVSSRGYYAGAQQERDCPPFIHYGSGR